jgi:uncharacterized membrane protein YoaK (UPF0700 family)
MPDNSFSKTEPKTTRFVLSSASLLAALAGYVNTIFLSLYLLPVSHLSGTLSRFSLDIGKRDLGDLGQISGIIVGFLLGAMLSGLIIGNSTVQLGRRYGVVLVLEGCFLALSAWLLHISPLVAVSLASLACGIQNGMASNYRGMIIRTTHITGVFTDLGVLLGRWLRYRKADTWQFALLVFTIVSFVLGGLLGAVMTKFFAGNALWFAAGVTSSIGSAYFAWRHYLAMKDKPNSEGARASSWGK